MEQIAQLLLGDTSFHPQPPQALPKGNFHAVTLLFIHINYSKSGSGIQVPPEKNVAFCHVLFIK